MCRAALHPAPEAVAASTVAAECGYAVWDLHRELRGTDLDRYWAADGLHVSDTSHAMIAARLEERLAPRYRR